MIQYAIWVAGCTSMLQVAIYLILWWVPPKFDNEENGQ